MVLVEGVTCPSIHAQNVYCFYAADGDPSLAAAKDICMDAATEVVWMVFSPLKDKQRTALEALKTCPWQEFG